ncbi:hypothetical protein CAEBREN_04751 [Caenorhabditis brenneri]|uniref:Uncharacterized protein n=1 Tax=Caenorhabditis brenneri TaxID=135651 RepID=G0N4Y2_CAEBE|nr:hypothetical protein CAEBREN_04751 [Caenorhabditis brenneri]
MDPVRGICYTAPIAYPLTMVMSSNDILHATLPSPPYFVTKATPPDDGVIYLQAATDQQRPTCYGVGSVGPIHVQQFEPEPPVKVPTFGADLVLPDGKGTNIYSWTPLDLVNWMHKVLAKPKGTQKACDSILSQEYDGSVIPCFFKDIESAKDCFPVLRGEWIKLRNHAATVFNAHLQELYNSQKSAYKAQKQCGNPNCRSCK